MLEASLVIAGVTLAAGAVPILMRRTDRGLHFWIALATGVFLGVVFLHLLPEIARMERELGGGRALSLWLFVLLGLVGLYLLENLVFSSEGAERHLTVGYASFLGLCIHAFTAGLGLAAAAERPELETPMLVSIVGHKFAESFSLTSVFLLAGFRRRRVLCLLLLFATVTPMGVFVGRVWVSTLESYGVAVLTALAAGTFLFVALLDLLPEVFHHREDVGKRIAALVAGVALVVAMHLVQA